MPNPRNSLFSFLPILPHLILIALVVGGYYYIIQNHLFPEWIVYIGYAVKTLIGFEMVLTAARSILSPIIGIIIAAAIIAATQMGNIDLVVAGSAEGWQLLVMSMIGLLVSIFMRF